MKYDDLVHVIDELKGDGLPNVSVSPVNDLERTRHAHSSTWKAIW